MSTVEELIREQPEPQRSLLWRLRGMLISAAPEVRERIRYHIPFFDCPRWFCYLNPLKKGGVELCFLRGFELSNAQALLEARDRQSVKGVTIQDLADFAEKEESLREIIQEALLLEERIGNRPPFSKKK